MRVRAVVRRLLHGFRRDRRTLALMMAAPLLVLTLLWVIFRSGDYHPRLALVDVTHELRDGLERRGARLRDLDDLVAAEALLARNEIDGVVSLRGEDRGLVIRLEGSDPTVSAAVRRMFADIVQERAVAAQERLKQLPPLLVPPEARGVRLPRWEYLHGGERTSQFDSFGPVLLGLMVFFFTFIVSGVSFVRERTTGTLERILAAPIRSWELVVGYALAFSVLVLVQATLVSVVSIYLLGMVLVGSFAWLLVITLMLAISAMTLGMLISALASSEFQVFQFIPIVILPQVFFSGLFHLDTMAPWLRALGEVLPLTYGAHAMRQVMIRGGGFGDIAGDLAFLGGCALLFLALNVVTLERRRAV